MAHAEENGGVAPPEKCTVADLSEVTPSTALSNGEGTDDESMGGSDVSSDYADISTDDDVDSLDSENEELEGLSPSERAEQERFGADYAGPRLEDREASRLLILMAHASTCPCQHKSNDHAETCRSVKWMMLHVRDCPGTTANFDVCPFPWCRKVKHLLYHLVTCEDPQSCQICAPADIGKNFVHLKLHSEHRLKAFRQTLLAKFASSPKKAAGAALAVDAPAAAAAPLPVAPPAKPSADTLENRSDVTKESVSTAPVPPASLPQPEVIAGVQNTQSDAPAWLTSDSTPNVPREPAPADEKTQGPLSDAPPVIDHPVVVNCGQLLGTVVESSSINKNDNNPAMPKVKEELTEEKTTKDESSKIKHPDASQKPGETEQNPQPEESKVTRDSLNEDETKVTEKGNFTKEKMPDTENAGVRVSHSAHVNTGVAVKTEEPEVVPDAATGTTSEYGALVENTNTGDQTSEPLKAQ